MSVKRSKPETAGFRGRQHQFHSQSTYYIVANRNVWTSREIATGYTWHLLLLDSIASEKLEQTLMNTFIHISRTRTTGLSDVQNAINKSYCIKMYILIWIHSLLDSYFIDDHFEIYCRNLMGVVHQIFQTLFSFFFFFINFISTSAFYFSYILF